MLGKTRVGVYQPSGKICSNPNFCEAEFLQQHPKSRFPKQLMFGHLLIVYCALLSKLCSIDQNHSNAQ
jgi:hypothetical protein